MPLPTVGRTVWEIRSCGYPPISQLSLVACPRNQIFRHVFLGEKFAAP